MSSSTYINGIKVFSFEDCKQLIDFISKEKKILFAINAEKILHSTPETINIINNNVGYADGIGAVMALKKKGLKTAKKIPGVELWYEIVKRYFDSKSFYLVGSTEDVICETIASLKRDFPCIKICGYRNGYLKEGDKEKLFSEIKTLQPDVVFIAMGSPKQEHLMAELFKIHPALYQGLGGSFDVYTGAVKRAPKWWLKNNLEWAYRLLSQPARIKRQIHLLRFFWLLTLNKF